MFETRVKLQNMRSSRDPRLTDVTLDQIDSLKHSVAFFEVRLCLVDFISAVKSVVYMMWRNSRW